MQTRRGYDQHLHTGFRIRPGSVRPESHRNVPRQSLFHHALYARPVSPDGLHVAKNEDHSLINVNARSSPAEAGSGEIRDLIATSKTRAVPVPASLPCKLS